MTFTDEPLHEIVAWLRQGLETLPPGETLEMTVLDPDLSQGCYTGERLEVEGKIYRHHSYRSWLDLAERLGCRFLTPERVDEIGVRLRFTPLNFTRSPHTHAPEDATEKYGAASPFASIDKLEEPAFLLDYEEALARVGLQPESAVLDLGVNTGDEFTPFERLIPPGVYENISFTGIDHAESVVLRARERFPAPNFRFFQEDINRLGNLNLPRFDLVISVGTLQSPGVRSHEVFRALIQHHLKERSGLILGFPNCRYVDGEVVYGARVKNLREPEGSLLIKDLAFYKKYLQQHRFRVFVTGKYYLFLTGVRR